ALDRLFALAVAAVAATPALGIMGLVPQMFGHLGFKRPLDHPFGQLLQQSVLAQKVLRALAALQELIEQDVGGVLGSGHWFSFLLVIDDQLHSYLYTLPLLPPLVSPPRFVRQNLVTPAAWLPLPCV